MKVMILAGLVSMVAVNAAIASDIITKSVNISSSKVAWKGHKVLGSHHGSISIQSGDLQFSEDGMLVGGHFSIDMNSITCEDLTGNSNAKLVAHLKSDDFFSSSTYPEAKFQITRVVPKGTPGDFKIVGDLTIKNITKEIKFEAKITDTQAFAAVKVDRSDFNVRFGSGSFFSNLGDKTIYDEFDLDITLVF
ncbi:MAG TPA: YceI family protein [Saprospiraceae bacterium]|nr:YceI family protein [Saprospiraceae bacterium]